MLLPQPKTTPPPSHRHHHAHGSRSPHGSPRRRRRPPASPTARAMLAVAAWVRARHWSRRCLLLALCSPLLVPLLCATFPLLCAAELCLRLCCRKRRSGDEGCGGGEGEEEQEDEEAAERLRRCEEGRCGGGESEVGLLLQRYLEDQLRLVGSVYECGDDGDGVGDGDDNDGDVGFLESCRSPLLA
ncbi:hypothetical protein BT93_F2368 [Corymbia citriodora subsp. variegata]|nr:hypothetical protein BT93_F2368 [Corymbia citriodora subsp. variegata]